ncbi:hypothetical protein [Haloferula sargassicola]|uniref:Uncharacterized protein n=1 Tax=Haloferula sargassicola TaxID=490096 RepID=A0ABP9UK35_9BACT
MSSRILILLFLLLPLFYLRADPLLRLHDGEKWTAIDRAKWEKLPRTKVNATSRSEEKTVFEGVPIGEILKLLHAPTGDQRRAEKMKLMVLMTARDGYQTAFSLAELDDSFRKRGIILADSASGKSLSDFEGPLMIVVPDEERHSRWIRQVSQIALITVRNSPPP